MFIKKEIQQDIKNLLIQVIQQAKEIEKIQKESSKHLAFEENIQELSQKFNDRYNPNSLTLKEREQKYIVAFYKETKEDVALHFYIKRAGDWKDYPVICLKDITIFDKDYNIISLNINSKDYKIYIDNKMSYRLYKVDSLDNEEETHNIEDAYILKLEEYKSQDYIQNEELLKKILNTIIDTQNQLISSIDNLIEMFYKEKKNSLQEKLKTILK